jgi:glycosyltransferase involved in cell wall biosynthesis
MRILQLAPLWERVPPPAYGGIEYMVSVLTDELVRQGHEVTLVASGDSQTTASLSAIRHTSLRTAADVSDAAPYTWLHVARALKQAKAFDIVHNHAGELAMAMHRLADVPMLTTLHNLITPEAAAIWAGYKGYYNTPSRSAAHNLTYPNFAGVVHHGLDVASFPFLADKQDSLLFLSRMSPEKGPLKAIEVAKRLGKRLIMAGKVGDQDREFFSTRVAPLIDGNLVQYVGEADYDLKRELYAQACCLLFPITWNEPFGLVVIEAMACGTPVIAFRRGAAPEIVADGLSGYLVGNVAEMADAVKRIGEIDPIAVRSYVERRFSVQAMAKAYVQIYEGIVAPQRGRQRQPVRLPARPATMAH